MTSTSQALKALNNAILDLQSADYNTFHHPLKKIAAALSSDALSEPRAQLVDDVNLEEFLSSLNKGSGQMGGAILEWPDDPSTELGVRILLLEKAADEPRWFMDFCHDFYYSGPKLIAGIQKATSSFIIPFYRDFSDYVRSQRWGKVGITDFSSNINVFVVHGHDEAPREKVARFLSNLGLNPIILHEQANAGKTIPEKLEMFSDVGFAVVLLTPDDFGRSISDKKEKPRARQNVILELGYFIGKLGRERVSALLRDDVEIPSDYLNVGYIRFDQDDGWKQKLARELDHAGYELNARALLSS
tara:strand:- start:105 stop:1010 length:906 start_codon:yes stop_codon:yes gene_type:complete